MCTRIPSTFLIAKFPEYLTGGVFMGEIIGKQFMSHTNNVLKIPHDTMMIGKSCVNGT